MYHKDSDYALNKRDFDAIVYKTQDNKLIKLSKSDFDSEAEFQYWKALSDSYFHDEEVRTQRDDRAAIRYIRNEGIMSESTTFSLDDLASEFPDEDIGYQILLHHVWKTLTSVQRRRAELRLSGLSLEEIASREGVSRQSVHESLIGARKRIRKFCKQIMNIP